MLKNLLKNKVYRPVMQFLKQGMTPEKLALTIALGTVIGLFPVIGPTTLMCALAAIIFKVNPAAIQLVNYVTYPLQILFIIPQYKAGAYIFGGGSFVLTLDELLLKFKSDVLELFQSLLWATVYAVGIWCILAPILTLLLYFLLFPIFLRLRRFNNSALY